MKNILRNLLLFTLLFSMVCFTSGFIKAVSNGQVSKIVSEKTLIKAYYFHGNKRCSTCKKIDEYSKNAIEKGFPNEIKQNKIKFQSINIDLPDNEYLVDKFELAGSSLVLVHYKNGKQISFKTLNKVWQLTGNQAEFEKYIQSEIKQILKE